MFTGTRGAVEVKIDVMMIPVPLALCNGLLSIQERLDPVTTALDSNPHEMRTNQKILSANIILKRMVAAKCTCWPTFALRLVQ